MVLHFQSDLFSNKNLRANIKTRKDTKKAQLILNRETEKTGSPCWIWGKERGEKKKIEKEKKKSMMGSLMWLNKNVTTINTPLQLIYIYL